MDWSLSDEEIQGRIDAWREKYNRVRPHDRTITIYRLEAEPELVNIRQELSAEPHLPGFRVAAAEIFA